MIDLSIPLLTLILAVVSYIGSLVFKVGVTLTRLTIEIDHIKETQKSIYEDTEMLKKEFRK